MALVEIIWQLISLATVASLHKFGANTALDFKASLNKFASTVLLFPVIDNSPSAPTTQILALFFEEALTT